MHGGGRGDVFFPGPRSVPSAGFGNRAVRYLAASLTLSTIASAPSFVDA
jgi:hypothetical protein